MSNSRNWCFTINNWCEEEYDTVLALECRFLIVGKEVGEEEQTPHLQGYIQFNGVMRRTTLSKKLPRAHLEPARGDAKANIAYCSKSGCFETKGEPKEQGRRTDLEGACEMVKTGAPLAEIAAEHPVVTVKYGRGLLHLQSLCFPARKRDNINVLWLWGPTGAGKTRYAFDNYKNPYIKDETQWWDGYDNASHDVVVIDDFDGKWPFRNLLRLLDRYPCRVQYKGGYVAMNCENFIITCDKTPKEAYNRIPEHEYGQLLRRIKEVRYIGVSDVSEVPGNNVPAPEYTDGELEELLAELG